MSIMQSCTEIICLILENMRENFWKSWPFQPELWSPWTLNKAVLGRRLCMYTIFGIWATTSAYSMIKAEKSTVYFFATLYTFVYNVLNTGWLLVKLGNAIGNRTVLGKRVTRMHLDILLYTSTIIHLGCFVLAFSEALPFGFTLLISMIILIVTVLHVPGYIAAQEPDKEHFPPVDKKDVSESHQGPYPLLEEKKSVQPSVALRPPPPPPLLYANAGAKLQPPELATSYFNPKEQTPSSEPVTPYMDKAARGKPNIASMV